MSEATDERVVRDYIMAMPEQEAKSQLCRAVGLGNIREKLEWSKFLGRLAEVADVCEHGVEIGDWCDPCNREYKRAAATDG